jgi:hypothetical protein
MKKLLLVLLALPLIGFGQNVNIPDVFFKAYLLGNTAINTNGDTEIQVSEATAFNGGIYCQSMSISNLTGIEAFTALFTLYCWGNQLSSLDVSQNTALTQLYCYSNQLTSLDVRNGIITNFQFFYAQDNPNLYCIDVDDATWSTANWTIANNNIDSQSYFSNNCPPSAIQEQTTNKELLKITDLLGRETKATNQLLFYIYNDGTVEKKVVVE